MANDDLSNQIQLIRRSGEPLPGSVKPFMESRFGTDFSHVNIHTGDYES